MSVSGFDELSKRLTELSNNAQELAEKEHSIPLPELLTSEFLSGCTKFYSVEDMFDSSGFKVKTLRDFAEIPSDQWDDFIKTNTSYESWEALLGAAVQNWTAKKLGF